MIPDKWIKTKSDEAAVDAGHYFDQSAAEKVRRFLETHCIQSVGTFQGKPLELLQWQLDDLIYPLYGWLKPDGSRRFLSCSAWLPKSNGKSTIGAGLCLYHLLADGQQFANVVCMATDIEQAGIAFKFAVDMIQQNQKIRDNKRVWVRENIKTIEYGRSTYKVLSGERGGNKRGRPLTFLLWDEIAVLKDRKVFDDMYENVSKIPGLMLSISTAGHNRESIGYEQFTLAQNIIQGKVIDTTVLPIVYAADPSDDWKDIDTFARVNPSYPVTIRKDVVEAKIAEAINEPRKLNTYLQQRLNVWSGAQTAWLSPIKWEECGEDFREEELYGSNAYVGIDYAWRGDLCSAVIAVERSAYVYLLPRFFTPRKFADQKEASDHVPYSSWARNPRYNLHLTPGETVDYEYLRKTLLEDSEHFCFQEVAYDPAGLGETALICEREYGWKMVTTPQRPRYTGAAASWFERAVLSQTIKHPKNPILDWCLQNCAVKEMADGLMVMKGSGYTQRIDGIIAAIMAISRYIVREDNGGYWNNPDCWE